MRRRRVTRQRSTTFCLFFRQRRDNGVDEEGDGATDDDGDNDDGATDDDVDEDGDGDGATDDDGDGDGKA